MLHKRTCVAGFVAAMMIVATFAARAAAGDASSAEIEKLRQDIEELRRKLRDTPTARATTSTVDRALDSKYGPNAAVTTKIGKLNISGLLQVWFYSIRNDNEGVFSDPNINAIPDSNEASDNDSFAIRRSELKFTMDIHENVTAVVLIDPAAEINTLPNVTNNAANQGSLFKTINNVEPEFDAANNAQGAPATNVISRMQTGGGSVPRLLRDAYINYHGVIPHHDFQIGQFKPFMGEEGIRSSAQLDFVERSFVGTVNDKRDIGVTVHGTWWDDRFQYWIGAFNGAGNYFGTAGVNYNRSDDNDEKDFNYRLMIRPLWNQETWGSLELGWSQMMGRHGEAGGRDMVNTPVNGLNRNANWAIKSAAWASYKPGGPVRGWWLRGEYAYIKDRNAPSQVIDLLGAGGSLSGFEQADPHTVNVEGWYFATGYKISESVWCDSAPSWLKPWEFTFRYQSMENIMTADLIVPGKTDVFHTTVWTGGLNYYIRGHNAKIQLNYNAIKNETPDNATRNFHEVENNSFVVNFQVAF